MSDEELKEAERTFPLLKGEVALKRYLETKNRNPLDEYLWGDCWNQLGEDE